MKFMARLGRAAEGATGPALAPYVDCTSYSALVNSG
jgi:hypothetical protein